MITHEKIECTSVKSQRETKMYRAILECQKWGVRFCIEINSNCYLNALYTLMDILKDAQVEVVRIVRELKPLKTKKYERNIENHT